MTDAPAGPSFWYSDDAHEQRGTAVLQALRHYRAAESAMRLRTRDALGLNETDLSAVRFLLAATNRGEKVSPTALSKHLQISSASVSAMLVRLEQAGHVTRAMNPHDARGTVVVPTASADHDVRTVLGDMHERIQSAVASLSAADATTVITFLDRLRGALDVSVQVDATHAAPV